jgi:hypothetical protein
MKNDLSTFSALDLKFNWLKKVLSDWVLDLLAS